VLIASNATKNIATGIIFAMLGAVAFSGKAIIVKLAYRYGVDAVTLIMLRMVFALPFFLAMAWWAGRSTARVQPVVLSRTDKVGIFGLGLTGYYLASFLDFAGLQYITASLERLILYLNPTLVLLLSWGLLKKRITAHQAIGMAISYAGVLLVFGRESQLQGTQVGLGAVLVFLSAVSYAIYLFYSGELVQRIGSMRLVGLATSVACVLCIAQYAVQRPLDSVLSVAPQVIWLSVLNATLCTVLPVMLVMMAIERIGAPLSAQVGMVGPMSTMLMGVLILDEPLTVWLVLGTALVLAGVGVCTRARRPAVAH
jgi:drug/metabolite transporter (DMT)-like permease